MKATKYTVTIVLEALSLDCVNGLVSQALLQMDSEVVNGRLSHDDGDSVSWDVETKDVVI